MKTKEFYLNSALLGAVLTLVYVLIAPPKMELPEVETDAPIEEAQPLTPNEAKRARLRAEFVEDIENLEKREFLRAGGTESEWLVMEELKGIRKSIEN